MPAKTMLWGGDGGGQGFHCSGGRPCRERSLRGGIEQGAGGSPCGVWGGSASSRRDSQGRGRGRGKGRGCGGGAIEPSPLAPSLAGPDPVDELAPEVAPLATPPLLPDSVAEPATPLAAPAGGEPAAAVGANTLSRGGFTIT
jgi:hypothetical protein